MICPHCGKEIETQQNRAAASRWSSMTKSQRSAEMSRVRKKGIKKQIAENGKTEPPKIAHEGAMVRLSKPRAKNVT